MSQKFETGADLKLAEVVVRAERAEAEVERLLPRAKLMTAVADKLPLCPDHRGKQHGTECLVCEVERLRELCAAIASGCDQCREGLAVSGQARGKIYHALKAYAIRLRKAAGRGEEL